MLLRVGSLLMVSAIVVRSHFMGGGYAAPTTVIGSEVFANYGCGGRMGPYYTPGCGCQSSCGGGGYQSSYRGGGGSGFGGGFSRGGMGFSRGGSGGYRSGSGMSGGGDSGPWSNGWEHLDPQGGHYHPEEKSKKKFEFTYESSEKDENADDLEPFPEELDEDKEDRITVAPRVHTTPPSDDLWEEQHATTKRPSVAADLDDEFPELESGEFDGVRTSQSSQAHGSQGSNWPSNAPRSRPMGMGGMGGGGGGSSGLGGLGIGGGVNAGPVGVQTGMGVSAPGLGSGMGGLGGGGMGGGGGNMFGIGSGLGIGIPGVGPIGVSSGLGIGK